MNQAMLASRRILRRWARVTTHTGVTQDREEKNGGARSTHVMRASTSHGGVSMGDRHRPLARW
jgi:hypothetical protein